MGSEPQTPLVVAIAGTSGAGKTSLGKRVAALLEDAVCLYFDQHSDYRFPNGDVWDEWTWVAGGCSPTAWCNPALAENLRQLKAGHPVEIPGKRGTVSPAGVVVLEEPFGRSRPEIADLIDYVVLVTVPLEIALARILDRSLRTDERRTTDPQAYLAWLQSYVSSKYPRCDRLGYEAVVALAGASCDLRIDGMQPLEISERQILAALHARFPDTLPNGGSAHETEIIVR